MKSIRIINIVSLMTILLMLVIPTAVAVNDSFTGKPIGPGDDTNLYNSVHNLIESDFNWQVVDEDEYAPDEDNVYPSPTANWDAYIIADHVNEWGPISNISLRWRAMNNNVVTQKSCTAFVRIDGTNYQGDLKTPPFNVWVNYSHVWANNPVTGQNWTWEQVDDLQIGFFSNGDGTKRAMCDFVYMTVNFTQTPPDVYKYNSTAIYSSSALLHGKFGGGNGSNYTCGFWYGNETTTQALVDSSYGTNVTAGNYTWNIPFEKQLMSLNSGQYYYVRPWILNASYFNASVNESYFLTKPRPPTNFRIANQTATTVTLNWTNATAKVDNITTVVRHSTEGFPSLVSGTEVYNGTAEGTIIGGLSATATHYFSAWTYINSSGSPFYSWMSDTFATASGGTEGGVYNITIRWEGNETLVNESTVCWEHSNFWVFTEDGYILNLTTPTSTPSIAQTENPFNVNLSYSPAGFVFDYCGLGMDRVVLPTSGSGNVTIYVTPRPEYNDSYEDEINATQIRYTFSFEDYTTSFQASSKSVLNVYKFNGSNRYYVHQDYWSAEKTVDVCLQYGDRYYLGVACPDLELDFLQYFDALATLNPVIQISSEGDAEYILEQYITINTSWDSTGLWINYTDSSYGTLNVSINIYDRTNHTEDDIWRNRTNFTTSANDYHWLVVSGCNLSNDYYFTIEIEHLLSDTNQTMYAYLYYSVETLIDEEERHWLEGLIRFFAGDSAVQSESGEEVDWLHLIAFGACMVTLTTFGRKYGTMALIGTGFLLIILETSVGLIVTRNVGLTTVGILGGTLMVLLGILGETGGHN